MRAGRKKNPTLIADIAKKGITLAELRQRSPVDAATITTDAIINTLFPGEPANVLICAGNDKNDAATRRKLAYNGAWEPYSFIVPNPMIAFRGTNKNGRPSSRCLSITGPRRFLVVESDPAKWHELSPAEQERFGSEDKYIATKKDEAAAVLWDLAERAPNAPLALVVDSAGKSIHGWFYVAEQTEEWCNRFFRYAVALGADKMLWTRCQLVRMPNGTRDNGKRQSVLFFNPNYVEVQ